jgi:molybdopterin biosynthesis enzyme MoaB
MAKRESRDGKTPLGATRVGLLLLPPGGWKAGRWLKGAVTEAWPFTRARKVESVAIEADERRLEKVVRKWADRDGVQVVLIVGRSGPERDDFAPDVTRRLLHRSLPGVEERMYLGPPRRPEDLLFRGAAGIRGRTIILNLPDRPERIRAVLRFMAPVLGHALAKIAGDESECGRPQGEAS